MEPLVVVEDDPAWPQRFHEVATYLMPFVSDAALRIEHVGSTSVPGLAAKPIIDIDVVVAEASTGAGVLQRIESAGYLSGWGTDGDRSRGVRTDSYAPLPEHHLYLVVENNRAHSDHWLLRDALTENPDLVERYAALKRDNVVVADGDRDRYTELESRVRRRGPD